MSSNAPQTSSISPPVAFQHRKNPAPTSTTTWLTPRSIIETLGPFALDPATPEEGMPWSTAKTMLKPSDDGLATPWDKDHLVWLNPPYGRGIELWIEKLVEHGNGFLLVNAATDTRYFQELVFPRADFVLFMSKRLRFLKPDGKPAGSNGTGSVLASFGDTASMRLMRAHEEGKLKGALASIGFTSRAA